MKELKRVYDPLTDETSVFYQIDYGYEIRVFVIHLFGNHLLEH